MLKKWEIVSNRLKEVRTDNKLTQEEFASRLDLKQAKIREIEGFRQKLTIEIATKVEDEFQINLRWLLTGRGDKYLNDSNNAVKVQNKSGNVAVNGNIITINTKDYADSVDMKELLELLKQVPKPWIEKILLKLKNHIKAFEEDF